MGAETYGKVLGLYADGKSVEEIADELVKSRAIVYRHLRVGERRGDVQMRNNESVHLAFRIVRDLKDGISQSDIARKHGISRQFVFSVKEMAEKENIL